MIANSSYRPGDRVVYTKQKFSTSPGPRAQEVTPAEKGDSYTYVVDKFWVVAGITEDGRLRLRTRRGKEHLVHPSDPMLRKAHWWEKLLYASRYQPRGDESTSSSDPSNKAAV